MLIKLIGLITLFMIVCTDGAIAFNDRENKTNLEYYGEIAIRLLEFFLLLMYVAK